MNATLRKWGRRLRAVACTVVGHPRRSPMHVWCAHCIEDWTVADPEAARSALEEFRRAARPSREEPGT